jgi:hypothetical protein
VSQIKFNGNQAEIGLWLGIVQAAVRAGQTSVAAVGIADHAVQAWRERVRKEP